MRIGRRRRRKGGTGAEESQTNFYFYWPIDKSALFPAVRVPVCSTVAAAAVQFPGNSQVECFRERRKTKRRRDKQVRDSDRTNAIRMRVKLSAPAALFETRSLGQVEREANNTAAKWSYLVRHLSIIYSVELVMA